MASQPDTTEAAGSNDIPLRTLYLQIEYAQTPSAILGISSPPTEAELRESYHALALRIHPDRAPGDNLRELHTSLFQKFQAAYEELLKTHFDQPSDDQFTTPKRLPETSESLHARNIAFQEALRNERETALKYKHATDAREAAKRATLEAKNGKLAQRREARAEMLQQSHEKKEEQIRKKSKRLAKRLQQTAIKDGNGAAVSKLMHDEPPLDWEEELERREAEKEPVEGDAEHKHTIATATAKKNAPAFPKRAAQNKPTARTARAMWDDAVDERLVSDTEIKGRWDKKLLSGVGTGSVSLSQKKQREQSGAARAHKVTKALAEEADGMVKPALMGNRTFSALVEEEIMESAFLARNTKLRRRQIECCN